MRTPVSVGVVGLGAWGAELVRACDELRSAELRWLLDDSSSAATRAWRRVPYTRLACRFEDLLEDETLDAVAIGTPAAGHADLVRRALRAGKHVLVQSPIAFESDEADELVRLAQDGNRRLVASNPVAFHPGARRLKDVVATGRLGELYHLHGSRQDLAVRRGDESVLWTLGAQAIAIVLWLVGDEPVDVIARGGPCARAEAADVAFCHLRFATGIEAALRLSCLEPLPGRRLTAVASRGMAIFDELDAERPFTLCETAEEGDGRGDVVSPRLPAADDVRAEVEHFLSVVSAPAEGAGAGRAGAAVVAVLEALQRSLERGGSREAIGALDAPIAGVIRLPLRSV